MITTLGSVLENGTLYIDIPTGTSTIDPTTGNPTPDKRQVEIHAYLKCDEKPPIQMLQTQPTDNPLIWATGWVTRMIDPLFPTLEFPPILPETVGAMVNATVGGVKGRFYPIAKIPNGALQEYECLDIVGEAIWGWFDVEGI